MSETGRKYCLITPCRDEALYARVTLEAVLHQTVLPALWVIVDDGSKDQTPQILEEYAAKVPWIRVIHRRDRGERLLGSGVIDAFYEGYVSIDPEEFDYVCKMDLDLDLPPRYFEMMMERMEADPRLGTCSGKPYFRRKTYLKSLEPTFPILPQKGFISEKCGDENSVGMIKFYRTKCFKQIGGFVRMLMWDGIDCHRCRIKGWVAESWDDSDIRFEHLRPMGTSDKSWWTGRVRHGVGQYFMGTSALYMFVSSLYRMTRPPLLIGGVAMLWGYIRSWLKGEPQYEDVEFRQFLRSYQRACLFRGKKRATAWVNSQQAGKWSAENPSLPRTKAAPAV